MPFGTMDVEKVLKRELVWRLGVRILFGQNANIVKTGLRGSFPWIVVNPLWVEKTPYGYLVADQGAHQVYIVDPDEGKIVWEYGELLQTTILNSPRCAQYLEDQDAILISDSGNNRILLVDRKTRTVLKTLTSTELGVFGTVVARKHVLDEDILHIVDIDNHVFVVADWNGKVYSYFGEYGVAGSDASHLNTPVFVDPWGAYSYPMRRVFVVDQKNHRILELDTYYSPARIACCYVTPNARTVHSLQGKGGWGLVIVAGSIGLESVRVGNQDSFYLGAGYTLLFERQDAEVWWTWPLGARFASLTDDLKIILQRHGLVWEVDLAMQPFRDLRVGAPLEIPLLYAKSLGAGESTGYIPFYTFMFKNTMIKALSTQNATLELYTLRGFMIRAHDCPPQWDLYDTIPLEANKPVHYILTNKTSVMAIRITMGSTAGEVYIWLYQG